MIEKPPTVPAELDYDGERFVPGADRDSQALHYHRYLAVLGIVGGKDVLDIASGEGFGSWFLSQTARSVTGVDLSAKSVAHAAQRYNRDNLRYREGDCRAIPLADASVDVVTSFETLEHISEHETFLKEIRRVLRPGGTLVISTPEIVSYNAALDAGNPFHVKELTRDAFRLLLSTHFANVAIYDQGLKLASLIWPEAGEAGRMCDQPWLRERDEGISGSAVMPDPVILIATASDAALDGIGGVFQEFPYAFPVSAIEGGTRERLEQAFGAEREALVNEVDRLTKLVQQQRQVLSDLTAIRMQPTVRKWKRKRRFYDTMARIDLLAGDRFGERMRQKREKYEKLLDTATSRNLKPAPLSNFDPIRLQEGNPKALTLGQEAEPVASIIIPVYNQIDYTLACLRSLARHETKLSFEVIVVDDCSSDKTEEELRAIPWIRYIRQPQNCGFIESCNTGLAASRGRYVVFLNNDTELMPGWLDELVRTFASFPNAGLVGSKLLYPDGTLQEAGGILWKDGSAWNFGRDQDPNQPEFCYARKVDYCSGASIMAPRKLLEQLGGFDRHFAPAYCEDSDLAMRVRRAGHDVIFQPLSKVIHYEGVTSGTDTGSGVKAYQVINSRKLVERWGGVLAERPENGRDPSNAKDFGLGKRLLVIDAITPEPDRDAGSVTSMEIMRSAQALGFQITFIPESNFADIPDYTAGIQRLGIEALYAPYCASVQDHLKQHGRRYDAILVYRVGTLWRCFEDLKRYAPQARIVYQTSDLHHLREARQAELNGDAELAAHAEKTKGRELELVGKCDCTIVHSLFEKDYLADMVPGAALEVFNWILDPIGTDVSFRQRSGMMFLGGYRHTPNVDAVHYFLDEIWPLVEPRLPGAKFFVVGSDLPAEIAARRSASVEMVGFVADLRPIMDRCRLSVVPLRFGAGTKGKLAMSLAYGLPAVTSAIGAEGMRLVDGDAVFVADDPKDFADRIVELHENAEAWTQMSKRAIDYVAENLSRSHGTEVVRRALIGK